MTHRLRTALAIGVLLTPLSAQLSQEGQPASDWARLLTDVPTAVMPEVDVESLLAEDAVTGPFPLRYGDVLTTDLGLENAGVWEAVAADGTRLGSSRSRASRCSPASCAAGVPSRSTSPS